MDHQDMNTCRIQLAWIATTTWRRLLLIRTSRAGSTKWWGSHAREPSTWTPARMGHDMMAIRSRKSKILAVFNVWAGLHRRFTGPTPALPLPFHIQPPSPYSTLSTFNLSFVFTSPLTVTNYSIFPFIFIIIIL